MDAGHRDPPPPPPRSAVVPSSRVSVDVVASHHAFLLSSAVITMFSIMWAFSYTWNRMFRNICAQKRVGQN